MSKDGSIKVGATAYSFNEDFFTYRYSFENCLELIGSLGPEQGVEIVAPQMMRGYPNVSEESQQTFLRARDRYGLVPTCFGGYSDAGIITGRDLNTEEQTDYLKVQMKTAKRLGFPVIRVGLCEAIFTNLVPYAEKLGIKMGIEIHAPKTVETHGELIERVKQVDSPSLGFVPDWGSMCNSVASVYVERHIARGVPREIADRIVQLWEQRVEPSVVEAEVAEMGGDELAQTMVQEAFVYFGHGDPAALNEIMPYIVHTHGKFFRVDDNGHAEGVRATEIIATLRGGGYSGWISAEYEGHRWVDTTKTKAIDQLKAMQALIRRELDATSAAA